MKQINLRYKSITNLTGFFISFSLEVAWFEQSLKVMETLVGMYKGKLTEEILKKNPHRGQQ